MTIKRQYGPLDFDQVASRSLYCFSSDIDEEEIPEMYEEDRQRGDTSYLDEYIPALKEYLLNREYTFEEKWFFIGGGMQKNEIHCAEGYLRHIWGIMTSPPFAHEEWPVPQEQYRDLISQIGLMRYYYLQSTYCQAHWENRLPESWTDHQCIWESLPPLDVSRLEDKEYLEAELESARRATENVSPLADTWWTQGWSGVPSGTVIPTLDEAAEHFQQVYANLPEELKDANPWYLKDPAELTQADLAEGAAMREVGQTEADLTWDFRPKQKEDSQTSGHKKKRRKKLR